MLFRSQTAAQIYDLPYLHRQMIETLGVKNAEKIVPTKDDMKPRDPVSENMSALVGKPMKAFLYQDHDAHLAVHQSFMQDPLIAAAIGQNPMTQQIMASLQSHIAEHLSFSYYKQMEERLGVSLPDPDTDLPQDIEVQFSKLLADAGKQLQQAHQQQASQQQAQQQQQDPLFQLEMQKLQTQQMEVQRKAQKDQADTQIAQQKLEIEKARIVSTTHGEQQRNQGQAQQAQGRLQLDALKTAIDAHLKHTQHTTQAQQSQRDHTFKQEQANKPKPKGTK